MDVKAVFPEAAEVAVVEAAGELHVEVVVEAAVEVVAVVEVAGSDRR